MRIKSVFKHSAQAVAEGSLVALLVVGLMAGSVLAAKPEGSGQGKPSGGGGTVSGPVMVADLNADGAPNRLDDITFTVSSTASAPFVGLRCWQGSTWVYDAYVGYFPSYIGDRFFRLQSDYWVAGVAASCTARLFYNDSRGREHIQNTLTFPVGA